MKTIKEGKKIEEEIDKRQTCEKCECVFEIEKSDLFEKKETYPAHLVSTSYYTTWVETTKLYVKCPCCNNDIYIKEKELRLGKSLPNGKEIFWD